MSSKLMKYKSFSGSVDFSLEDSILFGKIECINDLITYEAENISAIETAFHEAVDDYLETCELLNKEPEKPMSGSFNVRIGPDLHKEAYLSAKNDNLTLNEFIKDAVSEKLNKKQQELHMHIHIPKKDNDQKTYTSSFLSNQLDEGNVYHMAEARRQH